MKLKELAFHLRQIPKRIEAIPLPQLFLQKRAASTMGMAGGLLGGLMSLIVFYMFYGTAIPISMWTIVKMNSTIASLNLNGTAKTVWLGIFSNIFSGFNLTTPIPLIVSAGLIIGTIFSAFAMWGMSRR